MIKAYSSTVSSFVPSSFFLYPSVSHQLQTHKSERCNKSKLQCQNSWVSWHEALHGNNTGWAVTDRPPSPQKDTNRKRTAQWQRMSLTFWITALFFSPDVCHMAGTQFPHLSDGSFGKGTLSESFCNLFLRYTLHKLFLLLYRLLVKSKPMFIFFLSPVVHFIHLDHFERFKIPYWLYYVASSSRCSCQLPSFRDIDIK